MTDHCMQLIGKWHALRLDLEEKMFALTQDEAVFSVRGDYKKEFFYGHCSGEGGANYTRIQGLQKTFERIQDLYS